MPIMSKMKGQSLESQSTIMWIVTLSRYIQRLTEKWQDKTSDKPALFHPKDAKNGFRIIFSFLLRQMRNVINHPLYRSPQNHIITVEFLLLKHWCSSQFHLNGVFLEVYYCVRGWSTTNNESLNSSCLCY